MTVLNLPIVSVTGHFVSGIFSSHIPKSLGMHGEKLKLLVLFEIGNLFSMPVTFGLGFF
jgi:hypothetical protein